MIKSQRARFYLLVAVQPIVFSSLIMAAGMRWMACLAFCLTLVFFAFLGPNNGHAAETVKGVCTEGDCVNGKGTFRYEDGTVYTGQFRNAKRHGEGVYTLPNEETYTGQFADNLYSGFGVYRFNDGSRYEGQFAGGVYNGYGVYFFKDDTKKEGLWRNGAYYRPLGSDSGKTAGGENGKSTTDKADSKGLGKK